ncbi:unnamed protein product [Owenia fusiformis]|uniref:Mitogen-activated protein kinase kinase kinase n=1 Tax=Owenia fusiformis TaxID=6347 RepID=A0A8S4N791_OWEFU|nr:unnamed protein product [Owenia fusiformis]
MAGFEEESGTVRIFSKDDFTLLTQFDNGSFGRVYEAKLENHARHQRIAVKTFTQNIGDASSESRTQALIEEATQMFEAIHPNVVQILGIVLETNYHALVMDFCENGSVRDLLRSIPTISISLRYRILYQVAKAMNFLHQMNPAILHLDLKASNVLLDICCHVKICDFGLSESFSTKGGTVTHMSPQQLKDSGRPATKEDDMYSYGIFIWEVFSSGREPYKDSVDEETLNKLLLKIGQKLGGAFVTLGVVLGLDRSDIENIQISNPHFAQNWGYEILTTWKSRQDVDNTSIIEKLYEALRDDSVNRVDLAKLCGFDKSQHEIIEGVVRGMRPSDEFLLAPTADNRLEELYDFMRQCYTYKPTRRPTFEACSIYLETFLDTNEMNLIHEKYRGSFSKSSKIHDLDLSKAVKRTRCISSAVSTEGTASQVIHNAVCAGCNMEPIEGVRYICMDGHTFNLCALCHDNGDHDGDKMCKIVDPKQWTREQNNDGSPNNLHYGIICAICDGPVIGLRHECDTCEDFNFCNECIAKGNHTHHGITEYYKPEKPFDSKRGKPNTLKHNGIICDGCGSRRIFGRRYKCEECEDYNLCSVCKENIGFHNDHAFSLYESTKFGKNDVVWVSCSADDFPQLQRGFYIGKMAKIAGMRGIVSAIDEHVKDSDYYLRVTFIDGFEAPIHPDALTLVDTSRDEIKVGCKVIVLEDADKKARKKGYGKWDPEMSKLLGESGDVKSITADGQFCEVVIKGNEWMFHRSALRFVVAEDEEKKALVNSGIHDYIDVIREASSDFNVMGIINGIKKIKNHVKSMVPGD